MADTVDHRAGDSAGRIWRVKRRDLAARPWAPPRSAAEAVALFADSNGWRRSTAQRLLVEGRFSDAKAAVERLLDTKPSAVATVHALWTLDGLESLSADRIRAAARSPHAGVRETAARLAATRVAHASLAPAAKNADQHAENKKAAEELATEVAGVLAADADLQVRFAAALAAAACSRPAATDALGTAALQPGIDPWIARAVLSGAVGRAAGILTRLATSPVANDGTASGGVNPDVVTDLVSRLGTTAAGGSGRKSPRPVATTVADPAGGETAALGADAAAALALLDRRAAARNTSWFDVAVLDGLVAGAGLQAVLDRDPRSAGCRGALTKAVALAGDATVPAVRRSTAIRLLGAAAGSSQADVSGAARRALEQVVAAAGSTAVAGEALAALVRAADAVAAVAIVDGLMGLEPAVRAVAVKAILDRGVTAAALLKAIEAGTIPPAVVPLERRSALQAAADPAVKEAAVRIWAHGGSPGLSAEEVESLLVTIRRGGVAASGREVFVKNCGNCHRARGVGHQVGPDLAEAVERPVERLVMDIVDPNRSVEPRWEATLVVTTDGQAIEGLLASAGDESVVLVRAGGERQAVPRADIESLQARARSLMPEGFGRQIAPAEFADLIAYLRKRDP